MIVDFYQNISERIVDPIAYRGYFWDNTCSVKVTQKGDNTIEMKIWDKFTRADTKYLYVCSQVVESK